jgi:predicted O-methyltransferase YrrM
MDLFFRLVKYIQHFIFSKRKGHGIHSDFIYRFLEQAVYADYNHYFFKQVLEVRHKLKQNQIEIHVEDFGAGSKISGISAKRKISDIYKNSSSPHWKSCLYFRMLNYLKCKNILELGTNLGINAFTLSGLGKEVNVITVEGSGELCRYAENLMMEYHITNVKIYHQLFDNFLEHHDLSIMDAAVIDGNHKGEALMRYTQKIMLESTELKIIILDDIYWSKDMYEGWKSLQVQSESSFIFLDFYHFGVILKKMDMMEKKYYRLFV